MRAGAASAPAAKIAARLDVEDSLCVVSCERSNQDSDHNFRLAFQVCRSDCASI